MAASHHDGALAVSVAVMAQAEGMNSQPQVPPTLPVGSPLSGLGRQANASTLSAVSPLIRMSATHTSGAANAIAAPLGKTCHRSPVVTVSEQESAPPGRRLRRSNRTRSAYR